MSYDVAILQADSSGNVVQDMASSTNNGYKVTGRLKLLQRFMIELLTEKGSLVYLPNRGCNFVPLVRSSSTGTWDLIAAFSTALLDIIVNMSAEDTVREETDTAEMLSSVELVSLVMGDGTMALKVKLTSQDGMSFNAVIPLSFTDF